MTVICTVFDYCWRLECRACSTDRVDNTYIPSRRQVRGIFNYFSTFVHLRPISDAVSIATSCVRLRIYLWTLGCVLLSCRGNVAGANLCGKTANSWWRTVDFCWLCCYLWRSVFFLWRNRLRHYCWQRMWGCCLTCVVFRHVQFGVPVEEKRSDDADSYLWSRLFAESLTSNGFRQKWTLLVHERYKDLNVPTILIVLEASGCLECLHFVLVKKKKKIAECVLSEIFRCSVFALRLLTDLL